jgi:serine protease Do
MTIAQELLTSGRALSRELAEIATRVQPSVVRVGRHNGNGAGVIWRADGQIVTNHHVVSGTERAAIRLADGRRFEGTITARHPNRDLALVKIEATDLPAIEVGDSSTVRPGQIALAVGHPLGYNDAVTTGIVVASGQAATLDGPRTGDHLQTDVHLAPGNSGGPLIDALGRVIGINSMVAGRLALSIPSLTVERFVEGDQAGRAAAYIGVTGLLTPLRRPDYELGFLLTEVQDGSPADRAGILIGDIIVKFGQTPVIDQESVPAATLRLRPGAAVEIDLLRGGEFRSFVVVPADRITTQASGT